MHLFHAHGWEDRIDIIQEIEDERYRQIAQRIVAIERPDLLTVASALEELADVSQDATPAQQAQLANLERFLNGLGC